MALVSRILAHNHIPRYVRVRNAGFSVSLPCFRAPPPGPKPKPRSKKGSSTIYAQSRKHPDPQRSSARKEPLLEKAARWKYGWQAWYAERRSHRLAVWGVVIFVSGMTSIYLFLFESVPITGRKRISWLPRWELTKLENMEREVMQNIRKNEENLFIKSDYPGLRKIEAVLDRLVKASGLDDIAWEVRVLDEPNVDNAWVFRHGPVLITTGYFHHVIRNDDELAAVLSHEIVHVIAQHNLESNFVSLVDKHFTQPFSWLGLLAYLDARAIVFGVPIMASWLGSLALSRIREGEADYIGLLLMVDAGFDHSGAVSFWTKVNEWEEKQRRAKKQVRQVEQIRSTHPHVSRTQLSCTL